MRFTRPSSRLSTGVGRVRDGIPAKDVVIPIRFQDKTHFAGASLDNAHGRRRAAPCNADSATRGYQLRPAVTLSLDFASLFNVPQVLYRGFKDRTPRTILNFVTMTAAINGRF